jgi:hypothetical protein
MLLDREVGNLVGTQFSPQHCASVSSTPVPRPPQPDIKCRARLPLTLRGPVSAPDASRLVGSAQEEAMGICGQRTSQWHRPHPVSVRTLSPTPTCSHGQCPRPVCWGSLDIVTLRKWLQSDVPQLPFLGAHNLTQS